MNALQDVETLDDFASWLWQNMPGATWVIGANGQIIIKTNLVEVCGGLAPMSDGEW